MQTQISRLKCNHWSHLGRLFLIGLLVTILASAAILQIHDSQTVMAASNTTQKIIGFTGGTWNSSINLDQTNYIMSTYVRTVSNSDPTLQPEPGFSWSTMTTASNASHAKGVKYIPSLFSSPDSYYTNITSIIQNSNLRAQLVTNIKNMLVNYGWDGINLDLEITSDKAGQRPYMDALIRELYSVLNPLGKSIGVSSAWYAYDYSLDVANMVSFNNVMCYDLWSGTLPNGSRIYDTSAESYNDTIKVMNYWIQGGYPKDKMFMGIPSYSSPQSGYVQQKAQWVIDNGLAGIMIFQIDSAEPRQTVYNVFSSASPAPTPTSTPTPTPTTTRTPTPTPTSTPNPTPTPTPSGSTTVYSQNTSTNAIDNFGGRLWKSQNFITSTSHAVSQIKLLLNKTGNPSGNVVVHLRATDANGLPTGTDLATGSIPASNIVAGRNNWYTFNLGTSVSLRAGTRYAICMQALGSDLASNTIWYAVSTANPYSAGWVSESYSSGSGWSNVVSQTYDAAFQTLGQ